MQYRTGRLREIKTELTWTQHEQSDQAEKNRNEEKLDGRRGDYGWHFVEYDSQRHTLMFSRIVCICAAVNRTE